MAVTDPYSRRFYNMDVVRYLLSALVFSNHFFTLTGSGIVGTLPGGVQPCFFALSGFLAYHSYERSRSYGDYIVKRMARLMPLYWFVIILSALALVTVSDLSVTDYFSDRGFWTYLGANLLTLNFLSPDLPGVFSGDQFVHAAVNGSLWTMKVEIILTLTYPLIAKLFRGSLRQKNLVLLCVMFLSVAYCVVMNQLYYSTDKEIYRILTRQFLGWFYIFYAGMLIYLNLSFFLRWKWVIACVVFPLVAANYLWLGNPVVLRCGVLAVAVVWLSVVGQWGVKLSHSDNLSYGIYLCHFPLIQLAVFFGLPDNVPPGVLFVVLLAATVIVARLLVPPANRLSRRLAARRSRR